MRSATGWAISSANSGSMSIRSNTRTLLSLGSSVSMCAGMPRATLSGTAAHSAARAAAASLGGEDAGDDGDAVALQALGDGGEDVRTDDRHGRQPRTSTRVRGGASKNRTCDLILIRDAL